MFSPKDWEGSGLDATNYVAQDLKKCLEGLARHLFGMNCGALTLANRVAHVVYLSMYLRKEKTWVGVMNFLNV